MPTLYHGVLLELWVSVQTIDVDVLDMSINKIVL
jgi:hypothetical protein